MNYDDMNFKEATLDQQIVFEAILSELKVKGQSKSEEGTLFEKFCMQILKISPFFSDDIQEVWLWKDFPGNGGRHDDGIDLVALDKNSNYLAIQCKFYDYTGHVSKADIDSFISASTRPFVIEGKTYYFKEKLVFSTTDNISMNAQGLFTTFGPQSIMNCGIDWHAFSLDNMISMKAEQKKNPRPHQILAISKVLNSFEKYDRGRLIMACGTGKTFTSLKIVEGYVENNKINGANILYLVPSIALLSQTILEWKSQLNSIKGCDMFGICSDSTAGKTEKITVRDMMVTLMPIPATTDANLIKQQFDKCKNDGRIHFFFSTYQSIDVVHQVAETCGIQFDMAICDEAHRTIGSYKDEENISNFVKIHNNDYIPAKKRLYMTATEKIYSSGAKDKASDEGWNVYSMDDESVYGPQFHYLSFGDAVSQQLLTDYKLIVLDINKKNIVSLNLPTNNFANLDDAARIVGSLSALSKIASDNYKDEFAMDPNPMKRAVVFCSTIEHADMTAQSFNKLKNKTCLGEDYMNSQGYVIPSAKMICGSDNTSEKNKKLNWLRGNVNEGECKLLTNARCLSEGVDVPSLDAVIFMAKKRSQVDIIQAVGRVMRKFGSGNEKKYGYIIIPVVINDDRITDSTLSNNEDFKVVWQVVQALRSHDERLDAQINQIGMNKNLPSCICQINTFIAPQTKDGVVIGSRKKSNLLEGFDSDEPADYMNFSIQLPSDDELKKNDAVFASHLVKHCGNRLYWEDWSKNVGDVTNNVASLIDSQIKNNESTKKTFDQFHSSLRKLLNPSITENDCINMLAEHIVTLPVLKEVFGQSDLVDKNSVSIVMQKMVNKLFGIEKEIENLRPFYDSVKKTVEGIQTSEGRQEVIRKLFEKFFQYAVPKSAEKFGIVYTPVEIVDFIINSVSESMREFFGEALHDENVKILDPFTGTGTFVVRLLEKLKNECTDFEIVKYKYKNDIWCNEIMLLAYYIALINIEDTYGMFFDEFSSFDHAVLTDTFELYEKKMNAFYSNNFFEDEEFDNINNTAKEEINTNIKVVIGNPPYSAKQKNANNNNPNDQYHNLDSKITRLYSDGLKVTNKAALHDPYIRAFRWASDVIGDKGIVAYVTNGTFIDNVSFANFRKNLVDEFNKVYIFNLKGNFRKYKPEIEGDNVFGNSCGLTVCITILVKDSNAQKDGYVHYFEIADGLKQREKLDFLLKYKSIFELEWQKIYLDDNYDLLNKKNNDFSNFIILGGKKSDELSIFDKNYSSGIKTGKDSWMYNFDKEVLKENIKGYINSYNMLVDDAKVAFAENNVNGAKNQVECVKKLFDKNKNKYKNIKMNEEVASYAARLKYLEYKDEYIIESTYRPFVKKYFCYYPEIIQRTYKWPDILPEHDLCNKFITIPGLGSSKEFSSLMVDNICDLNVQSAGSQCFPLYTYIKASTHSLFASEGYERLDAINDKIIDSYKLKYNDDNITKEMVFYYIYAVFHSKGYKEKYSNNLAKELARIPYLKDFYEYVKIGKELAKLHCDYENLEPNRNVKLNIKKEDYNVVKIKFADKEKTKILFNQFIQISNIPSETYNYIVNGKSPIEWIIDQYSLSVDKETGIKDDPNKFDSVSGGKYILDLILKLITMSLKTNELIEKIPSYCEI